MTYDLWTTQGQPRMTTKEEEDHDNDEEDDVDDNVNTSSTHKTAHPPTHLIHPRYT